ncbi:MAG: tetraacyldisaccharide 4'-kinase [Rhodospirillaceae bacterium]|jgi:tetraacyldisaccharide 4'-kinase|nr:tetraacyldisaccharide 4'-kinase [Rhodospirillaceae bacterium]
MKTPAYWQAGQGGLTAKLLMPLSWVYRGGASVKQALGPDPWLAPIPVVCIGNATAGGAGKTPVALDVARRLSAKGAQPHFLTRGYGGRLKGPVRVDPERHNAQDAGDEALVLTRTAPTWIGADRAASAKLAVQAGADVLVMDDGFQNFTLEKTLSLLVVDGGFGIGNGCMMPAGPLREPLNNALLRAQAVICIGEDETGLLSNLPVAPQVITATVQPSGDTEAFRGKPYVAFAGIGRPEKFFDTLRIAGIELVDTVTFADHHPFSDTELTQLRKRAHGLAAGLITTEKDWVRLNESHRDAIDVLTIGMQWEDEGVIDALISPLVDGTLHAG